MNFSSQATTINGLILCLCVPALVLAVIIVIMIPIVRVYIRSVTRDIEEVAPS